MALNTWWEHEPTQRYWMEVATGEAGQALQSPKFLGANWSYQMVGQVRPGDRVLHWTSSNGRRLEGWSTVAATPTVVPKYTWQPRGSSGRALGAPRTTEGWFAPLIEFTPFANPVTSQLVQVLGNDLLNLRSALEAAYGKPTYFPFYRYGAAAIRVQQGYLLKFPVELFSILPGLESALLDTASGDDSSEIAEDDQTRKREAPKGRITRAQDPKLRAAIERRSLDLAKEYYYGLGVGSDDITELGKPYDLVVRIGGSERHAEVKGSSMLVQTVELTANEVTHARTCGAVDLIVVDGIEWRRLNDGSVSAWGGTLRVWSSWAVQDEDLRPRTFAYNLPPIG